MKKRMQRSAQSMNSELTECRCVHFFECLSLRNFKSSCRSLELSSIEALERVIEEGSIQAWIEKVGIVGVETVLEAFATGGFGQCKPSNMDHKKNKQTLVETQQLRNSITSDVK